MLAVVVGMLAMTLAVPFREFLAQRSQISSLRVKTAAQAAEVAELQRQKERWKDPAYVAAQARERLNFVRPGETRYIVLDPSESPPRDSAGRAPLSGAGATWYSRLAEALRAADELPAARR